MGELTAKVLSDNVAREGLPGEWGLSIYIEYRGRKLLLDTGASGLFLKNAQRLGVDISQVEFGVLSHAHDDHSDGMETFFQNNTKAPFYLRDGAGETCYGKTLIFSRYIGIRRGTLAAYPDRIRIASGDLEICPGVTLVPHKTPGLEKIGRKAHMYLRVGRRLQPDDFRHEQSLVLDTEKGLVIFNSCSHGGADTIIREVAQTFPGRKIYAIVGGFHLFASSPEEIHTLARGILDTGIEKVVTGHCTGQRAYDLLKQDLGQRLEQLYTGYTMEV